MKLTIDEALQKGIAAHKAGQFQEADRYYTAILGAWPKHPDANHNMGLLAISLGKIELALSFLKAALEANPSVDQYWLSYLDALINLGHQEVARDIFDKAKIHGAKGGKFDKIEEKLAISKFNAVFSKAVELKENGKFSEAIELITKKSDKLNEDPNQLALLAHCHILNGDTRQARRTNTKAMEIDPGLAAVGWNEARLLLKQRHVSKALQIAQNTNERFPNDVEGMVILGACLQAKGEFSRSLDILSEAIELSPNCAEAYLNRGLLYLNLKNKVQALSDLEKAHKTKPHITQIWKLIIGLYVEENRYQEAINSLVKMIEIDPKNPDLLTLLVSCNQELCDNKLAIMSYQRILELIPNNVLMHLNLGLALKKKGDFESAIAQFKKVLFIQPDSASAYNNIGNTLKQQGKLDEAIRAYKKALEMDNDFADVYNNLASVLRNQGELDEAIEAYKKAIALRPNYANAYNNMGNALKDQGKLDEAVGAYKKAIALKPNYANAYNNMGNALKRQGKLEKSIEAHKKALLIKPDFAAAYSNIGSALTHLGRLDEAIEAFNDSIAIQPDNAEFHHNLSYVMLNSGRVKEGLEEYEWRWKTTEFVNSNRLFSKPLWDGKENLKGQRILLWCEQGIGDTINWLSRVPLISSQAGHCILECQEKLVALLAQSFPNIEVRAENRSQDARRNDFDFHLPMGSLYRHFRSEISDPAQPYPYLIPDPVRIEFWRKRLKSLGNGPYIGVSWKSANMSPARLPNYAPISDWSPIFTTPNVTFVNLQYADYSDDLNKIKNEFGANVHNFDDLDHFNDLVDVAALCAALDIVVSTKLTVPLIAAGVGTITKLAIWRQSSWNNILHNPVGPMIDIFEKNTWETWQDVFGTIAEELKLYAVQTHAKTENNQSE